MVLFLKIRVEIKEEKTMNIEIAERLIKLRKENGYSQEDLANALGLSRQAVSKWERAESSPDTDNLICLARLYNMSLDELLNTSETTEEIIDNVKSKEEEQKEEEKQQMSRAFNITKIVVDSIVLFGSIIAYFIIGFAASGWHPWWVLFLLIPLTSSIFDAIAKKNPGEFYFPVLITIIYILVSHYFDLYHPFWIIYLTVPAFYTITSIFDKKEEKPEK